MRLRNSVIAACAASFLLAGFAALPAEARGRRAPFRVEGLSVVPDAPYAGSPLRMVRFVLFGPEGKSLRLTLDCATDEDGDLLVEKREFRRATVDSYLDKAPRDPYRRIAFEASPEGREHTIFWRAEDDYPRSQFLFEHPVRDTYGWVLDANPPGRPLTTGPGVGAALRLRARSRLVALSAPFDLDTGHAPALSIAYGNGTFSYDVTHPDSEDLNGDGVFDPAAGEDLDRDSLFDEQHVQLRFWFAPMPNGKTLTDELTPDEIAQLFWRVCTNDPSAGDPDRGVAASPVTQRHAFAWAYEADRISTEVPYVIGGVAVDDQGRTSAFVRMHDVVWLGQ